jgi:putative oxidoreductase
MQKSVTLHNYQDIAILVLRLTTAANFLSPVASRLGLWGKSGSNWQNFVTYTGEVNSYAPSSMVPFLAITATTFEIVIAFALLIGFKTRWAAFSAALLTLAFALAMTYSFGIKKPLDYSVFVDCTAAFLLATMPRYRWSMDE